MYFTKTVTAENGATVTHHRLMRIELSSDAQTVRIWGSSWVDLAAHQAGLSSVWPWYLQAAAASLNFGSGLPSALAGFITASTWFSGATVTAE